MANLALFQDFFKQIHNDVHIFPKKNSKECILVNYNVLPFQINIDNITIEYITICSILQANVLMDPGLTFI